MSTSLYPTPYHLNFQSREIIITRIMCELRPLLGDRLWRAGDMYVHILVINTKEDAIFLIY